MPAVDTRPPFAAIGGRVPGEFASLPTPCYLLDEGALARNAEILGELARRTGCKVLLAQKAFSNYDLYPVLAPYLAGTEASGLYEARLGAEEMPEGEVHVFCAAYRDDEMEELLRWADHIVFNSPAQLARFGPAAKAAGKSVGLRVNPECSTQEGHAIYDPCAPGSRLGTTRAQWDAAVAQNPALPRHEVAQHGRRPPYHPPRVRPGHPGNLHRPRPARLGRDGVSGTGGGLCPQRRVPADPGAGCGAQRRYHGGDSGRSPPTRGKSPVPCGWQAPPAWRGM